jgi:hypothetical protein
MKIGEKRYGMGADYKRSQDRVYELNGIPFKLISIVI